MKANNLRPPKLRLTLEEHANIKKRVILELKSVGLTRYTDEITQEVLIRYEKLACEGQYFNHTIIEILREMFGRPKNKKYHHPNALLELPNDTTKPCGFNDKLNQNDWLDWALQKISLRKDRLLLVLICVLDLRKTEAAEVLGWSGGNVWHRLRAINRELSGKPRKKQENKYLILKKSKRLK